MSVKFKSNVEVFSLAKQIKARRRELGLTIKLVERYIGVDCGQLSRFEAGKFKTYSKNLQILCKYMQIADWSCKSQDNSIRKVRSAKHRYIYFCTNTKRLKKEWLLSLSYPIIKDYPKGDNSNYVLGEYLQQKLIYKE